MLVSHNPIDPFSLLNERVISVAVRAGLIQVRERYSESETTGLEYQKKQTEDWFSKKGAFRGFPPEDYAFDPRGGEFFKVERRLLNEANLLQFFRFAFNAAQKILRSEFT